VESRCPKKDIPRELDLKFGYFYKLAVQKLFEDKLDEAYQAVSWHAGWIRFSCCRS
jgi:hypothetical protein